MSIPDNLLIVNILWWNINKRFNIYSKSSRKLNHPYFDGVYDMIFISETNLGYGVLPIFKNYVILADPDKKSCSFGGIAWYVKDRLASHLFHIQYHSSFISFRLDTYPVYIFIVFLARRFPDNLT